jgi:hypothetical protein
MHQMERPKKEKAKEDYDLLCLHCISHFGNEGKWERFGYGRCNRCDGKQLLYIELIAKS